MQHAAVMCQHHLSSDDNFWGHMYERCTLAKTVDASFPAHIQGLAEEENEVECVHPAYFSGQACRSFAAFPVIEILKRNILIFLWRFTLICFLAAIFYKLICLDINSSFNNFLLPKCKLFCIILADIIKFGTGKFGGKP